VTGERRPVLLIVNPISGGKPGSTPRLSDDHEKLKPEALAAALQSRGLSVRLHLLSEADDPADVARGDPDTDVVVAGGDGTVGPVAEVLARSDRALGILPMGSWNNIARGLGLPLELEPAHAEAAAAFGAYESEVIDKVGGMVAGLTYGAKKDSALKHFERAAKLFPASPIIHIEHANGLILLFGKARIDDATRLYEKAAALKPVDAMERLDIEHAKSELE